MSKKNKPQQNPAISRRQFLYGAGGFTLAIPFLPSLLTREALAATGSPRRVFFVTSAHGGVRPHMMYPLRADGSNSGGDQPIPSEFLAGSRKSLTMESQSLYSGHSIRRGSLSGLSYSANGRTSISPVLSAADASRLSPQLLAKMCIFQGLDVPQYWGHNYSMLGNPDGNVNGDQDRYPATPSIDQILAWSSKVYAGSPRARGVYAGTETSSWTYNNSAAFSQNVSGGGVSKVNRKSPRDIFNALFCDANGANCKAPSTSSPPVIVTPTATPQKLVVDRVVASWQSLRSGAFGTARRLSLEDRVRVDGFMQKLFELQKKLDTTTTTTTGGGGSASCKMPAQPSYLDISAYGSNRQTENPQAFQLLSDVIAAAFACDLTRIGTVNLEKVDCFPYSNPDASHNEIFHGDQTEDKQRLITQGFQTHFEFLIADLAKKLNSYSDNASGETVLDNSLVVWNMESGAHTHDTDSVPVITFGGLNGAFKTGYYYDYRNMSSPYGAGAYRKPGLHMSQFLVSVMKGMGLTEGDYLRHNANRPGYMDPYLDPNWKGEWGAPGLGLTSQIISDMGKVMPWAMNIA